MLIDAFDADGDGVITLTEFLEFTGDVAKQPDDGAGTDYSGENAASVRCECSGCRKGGRFVLSQRCCWVTTCPVTGMANAYTVSELTKKQSRAAEAKDDSSIILPAGRGSRSRGEDKDGSAAAADSSAMPSSMVGGNIKIVELKNGEKRMRAELPERRRREALLRRYGVITSSSSEERGKKEDDDDDGYGDDTEFDEGGGAADDDDAAAPGKSSGAAGGKKTCAFASWGADGRKAGLKFMSEATKDARQESILKAMLTNGEPPKPPVFSVVRSAGSGSSPVSQ